MARKSKRLAQCQSIAELRSLMPLIEPATSLDEGLAGPVVLELRRQELLPCVHALVVVIAFHVRLASQEAHGEGCALRLGFREVDLAADEDLLLLLFGDNNVALRLLTRVEAGDLILLRLVQDLVAVERLLAG